MVHAPRRSLTMRVPMLLAAGLLAACASSDDAGTPTGSLATGALPADQRLAAGQAQLAISRAGGIMYAGAPATVTVNGREVASLWAGASTNVAVPAGRLKIRVEAWSYPGAWEIELDAQEKHVYALDIEPRDESLLAGSLLGPIGGLVDAGSNGNQSGAFKLRVTSTRPQAG